MINERIKFEFNFQLKDFKGYMTVNDTDKPPKVFNVIIADEFIGILRLKNIWELEMPRDNSIKWNKYEQKSVAEILSEYIVDWYQ